LQPPSGRSQQKALNGQSGESSATGGFTWEQGLTPWLFRSSSCQESLSIPFLRNSLGLFFFFLRELLWRKQKALVEVAGSNPSKGQPGFGGIFTTVINSPALLCLSPPYPGVGTGLIDFSNSAFAEVKPSVILPPKPDLNCRIQRQKAGAPHLLHSSLWKRITLPFSYTDKNIFSYPTTFWLGYFCLWSGFPKPSPYPKSKGPQACWGATHKLQGNWTWTKPRKWSQIFPSACMDFDIIRVNPQMMQGKKK